MPQICSCCIHPGWRITIAAACHDAAKTRELRSLFLRILASMGVCLPETTKLPVDILFSRASRAIFSSQWLGMLASPSGFNCVEPWDRSICLTSAMRFEDVERDQHGYGETDPFQSLRSLLTFVIVYGYEHSCEPSYRIIPSQGSSVTKLKITGAYNVDPNFIPPVPLITLEYSCNPNPDTDRNEDREGKEVRLASDAYQLLDIILEENSWRLEQRKQWRSKREPTYSFLLPLSELLSRDIGSLSSNLGCVVCGRPIQGRCSRCQSMEYCGPACQRSHWKQHKQACFPLYGGTWIKILYFPVNRVSGSECSSKRLPPIWDCEPTSYGEDLFLVRVQAVQFSTGENELVVSDRKETFAGRFFREVDPTSYLLLFSALDDFHNRKKVYLWAKYLEAKMLSIRIDPKPDQTRLVW